MAKGAPLESRIAAFGMLVRDVAQPLASVVAVIGAFDSPGRRGAPRPRGRRRTSAPAMPRPVSASVTRPAAEHGETSTSPRARAARRRLGESIVLGARPAIDFHALETGGIWILQILDRPKPAAVIAFHECRLANHGLAGEER